MLLLTCSSPTPLTCPFPPNSCLTSFPRLPLDCLQALHQRGHPLLLPVARQPLDQLGALGAVQVGGVDGESGDEVDAC